MTEIIVSTTPPLTAFFHQLSKNKGAIVGLGFISTILIITALASWISPHSPTEQFRDALLTPPSWTEQGQWRFLLGTDELGRDILSRLIHGARLSLLIGTIIVATSLLGGVCLGLVAGFFGGWIDLIIMRLSDILLTLPSLLLAIVLVAVLGPGLINAGFALCLVYMPHYIRLTRASVLTEKKKDYVTASSLSGANSLRLMFLCILPNCLAPLIVQATLGFSNAILDMAALGFLGMGAQPPLPEWGAMLANAREFIQSAWWVVTFPGIVILLTVLSFNLLGDGLRDALDPKLKETR